MAQEADPKQTTKASMDTELGRLVVEQRLATSDEVKVLRSENRELKEVVAEITLKNRALKKGLLGHGAGDDS